MAHGSYPIQILIPNSIPTNQPVNHSTYQLLWLMVHIQSKFLIPNSIPTNQPVNHSTYPLLWFIVHSGNQIPNS